MSKKASSGNRGSDDESNKKSIGVNTLLSMETLNLGNLSDEDENENVPPSTANQTATSLASEQYEFPDIERIPVQYVDQATDTKDEEEDVDMRRETNEFRIMFYEGLASYRNYAVRTCANYYKAMRGDPFIPDDYSSSSSSTLVGDGCSSSSSEALLSPGSISGTDSSISTSSPPDEPIPDWVEFKNGLCVGSGWDTPPSSDFSASNGASPGSDCSAGVTEAGVRAGSAASDVRTGSAATGFRFGNAATGFRPDSAATDFRRDNAAFAVRTDSSPFVVHDIGVASGPHTGSDGSCNSRASSSTATLTSSSHPTNRHGSAPSFLDQSIANIDTFNFTEVDLRPHAFPRFDTQFSDEHYLYLEELSTQSLNNFLAKREEEKKKNK